GAGACEGRQGRRPGARSDALSAAAGAAEGAAAGGAAAMIDAIRARPILTSIGLLLLLILVLSAFPIVPETKQAVVVRFNNPVRILNQYEPGRPIGAAGAGISWRIPIAEQVVWIDKRVQDVDMQRQQVISTDQRR